MEHPPFKCITLMNRLNLFRQWVMGSFSGAEPSESVLEGPKGQLVLDGNQYGRAKA